LSPKKHTDFESLEYGILKKKKKENKGLAHSHACKVITYESDN